MSSVLLVPIHVDALALPRTVSVAGPLLDFRNLPWVASNGAGGWKEINPQTPFLSETVQAEPMSLGGSTLPAGVHLHWALPTALATGRHPDGDQTKLEFDDVPDRWLVSRWRGGLRKATWIVESNYVWAADEHVDDDKSETLTNWPWKLTFDENGIPRLDTELGQRPWRYLGRSRELSMPWPQTKEGEYLQRLTATGFGETSFAAFYPNCRSVFGLHDPNPAVPPADWYEVYGWYSNLDLDPVKRLAGDSEKLGARCHWAWDTKASPGRTLCYGRVYAGALTPVAPRKLDDLTVAIGSSTTEALAALLAKEMAAERRKDDTAGVARERNRLEDVLDAICLADRLPEREVDIGLELEMARHDRSYRPIAGSPLYRIVPRRERGQSAESRPSDAATLTLPIEIAGELNALNAAHQAWQRAMNEIRAGRDQLYSDWYRTMYHAANEDDHVNVASGLRGSVEVNLDVDDLVRLLRSRAQALAEMRVAAGEIVSPEVKDDSVRLFVQHSGSSRLRAITLTLKVEADKPAVWTAPPGESIPDWCANTLAARAVELRARLRLAVETHNKSTKPPAPTWELTYGPGPRYWAPNEPVLLFSGKGAEALARHQLSGTERHDSKGNLLCRVLPADPALDALLATPDAARFKAFESSPVRIAIEEAAAALGLSTPAPPSAKPFLLEWKISLSQAIAGCNYVAGVGHDYSPNYIRTNWSLGETNYEVRTRPLERVSQDQAVAATGRSFLGAHADATVRARLETYILNRLSQPVHRVTVNGPVTEKCWFPETVAYEDRKLDPAAAQSMKDWALDLRRKHSADEATISLKRMREVLGGVGLPDGGQLADFCLQVANALKSPAEIGIDADLWKKIVPTATTLAGLGTDTESAFVLSRLLQEAERQNKFGTNGRRWFPLVHGIPDRGCIAAAMVNVAATLDLAKLTADVKLPDSVAGALVDARQETPIDSLLRLASVPGMGPGSLGRLLAYVDANKLYRPLPPLDHVEEYIDTLGHHAIDALTEAIDAWQHLNQRPPSISQSLDGFHDALLMRRSGFQLPVADPMGFKDYRVFHENLVREAVGANIQRAPAIHNPYIPIRNGELRLMELRLVDIFGQVQDTSVRNQVAARSVRLSGTEEMMHLPPRLVQPGRINLRFMAAASGEEEWNSHPASSPICGWLVTDNLDSSILFYDPNGIAIGSLNREANWDPIPGATAPVRPEDIENPWLRAVAVELASKKPPKDRPAGALTPIEEFVEVLESALESIDPHSITSEEARTLLFSRPIAVTRIAASFELLSPPAPRQGLYDLAMEARGNDTRTDAFEQVKLPLRIGEHQRLSDGVVGYWLAGDKVFHAPQTAWVKGARDMDASSVHWLSIGEPLTATVLLDPRGTVHATSGILPPKRIKIPPDQYLPALGRIQVFLATAPILTLRNEIQVPLRLEPGWTWDWVAREPGGVVRVPMKPLLRRDVFLKSFPPAREPGGAKLWAYLLAARVLEVSAADPDQAVVHMENLEAANSIPPELQPDVRRLLETAGRKLSNPPGTADFTPRELREGWLAMTPAAKPEKGA